MSETQKSQLRDLIVQIASGAGGRSPACLSDLNSRDIVCTPFDGSYGRAGWVVAVNGSPPRGVVVMTFDGQRIGGVVVIRQSRSQRLSGTQARKFDRFAGWLLEHKQAFTIQGIAR